MYGGNSGANGANQSSFVLEEPHDEEEEDEDALDEADEDGFERDPRNQPEMQHRYQ